MDALATLVIIRRRRRRRKLRRYRRYWVHPLLSTRERHGHFNTLFEDLKLHDDKFFKYFRMSIATFNELLYLLQEHLKHQDTRLRKSITPAERLAITLRYLSTGCTFADFEFVYRCGSSTARMIVQETCLIIWKHLKDVCIPEPTEATWRNIADGFNEYANFPNCLGAIDGKHIRIIQPLDSGSLYYNYKIFFSMVLLAVCDVNYMFTFVDVGSYGKASDSTVYKESVLFQKMQQRSLNLPAPKPISTTSGPLNFSFVGDEAFGLSEHMLRPYSGKHLDFGKRIFNYRLSRARRCIECSFGILTNKWRILHRPLNVSIEFAEHIVKACCILHNFVRKRDGYNFHDTLTVTGLDNIENVQMPLLRSITTRDKLQNFFLSEEGRIPWQEQII